MRTLSFLLALTATTSPAYAQLSAGHDLCEYNIVATDGQDVGNVEITSYPSGARWVDGYRSMGVESWSYSEDIWSMDSFSLVPDSSCSDTSDETVAYEQLGFPGTAEAIESSVHLPFAVFEIALCGDWDASGPCTVMAWLEVGEEGELAWFAAPGLESARTIRADEGELLEFTQISSLPASPSTARRIVQSPR